MKQLNEKNLKNFGTQFKVNDVTSFFGITPRILKHYETTGVLTPTRSRDNDYRLYSAEDAIKVQTAERLKGADFTQKEIAAYFAGGLDVEEKLNTLIAKRALIDSYIDMLTLELDIGKPKFSVYDGRSFACYCKTFDATGDPLQIYLDSKEAYSDAISNGCRCDVNNTFFVLREDFFPLPYADGAADSQSDDIVPEAAVEGKIYRVCVPILCAPENVPCERVTLKKSLVMKYTGEPLGGGKSYYLLQNEAARLGLTLTGREWTVSETGPNKKTANRTYTLVIAGEIE